MCAFPIILGGVSLSLCCGVIIDLDRFLFFSLSVGGCFHAVWCGGRVWGGVGAGGVPVGWSGRGWGWLLKR